MFLGRHSTIQTQPRCHEVEPLEDDEADAEDSPTIVAPLTVEDVTDDIADDIAEDIAEDIVQQFSVEDITE